MSVDFGKATVIVSEILAGSKSVSGGLTDLVTLYKAYADAKGVNGIGAVAAHLDKDGLFVPTFGAVADLAPVLRDMAQNPLEKTQLIAFLASLDDTKD